MSNGALNDAPHVDTVRCDVAFWRKAVATCDPEGSLKMDPTPSHLACAVVARDGPCGPSAVAHRFAARVGEDNASLHFPDRIQKQSRLAAVGELPDLVRVDIRHGKTVGDKEAAGLHFGGELLPERGHRGG